MPKAKNTKKSAVNKTKSAGQPVNTVAKTPRTSSKKKSTDTQSDGQPVKSALTFVRDTGL